MSVDTTFQNCKGNLNVNINAMTTEKVTGRVEVTDCHRMKSQYDNLEDPEFPQVGKRPTIDILIGLDYAELHSSLREVIGKPGEPIARPTPLGWTSVWAFGNHGQGNDTNHGFFSSADNDLNNLVTRMWEHEELTTMIGLKFSKYEAITLERTLESMKELPTGRYQVGVPWKDSGRKEKNNSLKMAIKRLESNGKNLSKEPEEAKAYGSILKTHEEKGYIMEVGPANGKKDGWILPHFPIVRPTAETIKVRIVFDASARVDGVSLIDQIIAGPKFQRDLSSLLKRFRRKPVALVADVAEMYLQVELAESVRKFHRFLWRKRNDVTPTVYEKNRVVLGVNASPFLEQMVTQEHARQNREKYPVAANAILESTYMDDSMDSVHGVAEALELFQQLSELWATAGMHARKWASNSVAVLSHISGEDQAKHIA